MSSKEWRPDDGENEIEDGLPFGDALAEVAIDRESDVDPVEAVRESRENV